MIQNTRQTGYWPLVQLPPPRCAPTPMAPLSANPPEGLHGSMPLFLRLLLRLLLLAGALGAWQPAAATEPARVLLLMSTGNTTPWSVQFAQALRGALLRGHPRAELDIEMISGPRVPPSGTPELPPWLALKYAGRRYDVVVAGTAEQLPLGLALRGRLWPEATLIAPTLDVAQAEALKGVPRLTGLVSGNFVRQNLALVFQVLPGTRHVGVIATRLDNDSIRPRWRSELSRWQARASLIDLSGLDTEEMLKRVQRLPPDTVLYFAVPVTTTGTVMLQRDLLQQVAATARAPVFVDASPLLDTGAVGGWVMLPDVVARDVASQLDRLLAGTPSERIGIEPHTPPRLQLDWRALQRWGIAGERLPADSEVLFQPPGLWQAYRGAVLAAVAVLLVQSALILALVLERRRRRGAELRAHRHLRDLARLNRSGAISALSAALAHEINQPLGSILSNAETAELLLEAPQPPRDELRELMSAIREDDLRAAAVLGRLRTWIAKAPSEPQRLSINGLAEEVARMLRIELRLREAELVLQLEDGLPEVQADGVQIQQVVLNLVLNALDAMQPLPPRRRCVTLRTERNAKGGVDVCVADQGPGLSGVPAERLFEPFFSTKPQGLGVGLSISRSIVEHHGGTLRAEAPVHGGGAVFRFTLPATPKVTHDTDAAPGR